ncbi:type II toxin-antitoxin system ParD family antitoxin [soil metagenome]
MSPEGSTPMNISLTPELEQYIHAKVRSGLYHSASEVVREGLRMLKERDELHREKLEELRRAVQVGIDQADRGQSRPLTDEMAEEIKVRGRQRLAAREGKGSA